jgi:hypothetical protein
MAISKKSCIHVGNDDGINSGATSEFIITAGKADAMPAINHASASLLLVGNDM